MSTANSQVTAERCQQRGLGQPETILHVQRHKEESQRDGGKGARAIRQMPYPGVGGPANQRIMTPQGCPTGVRVPSRRSGSPARALAAGGGNPRASGCDAGGARVQELRGTGRSRVRSRRAHPGLVRTGPDQPAGLGGSPGEAGSGVAAALSESLWDDVHGHRAPMGVAGKHTAPGQIQISSQYWFFGTCVPHVARPKNYLCVSGA